MVCFVKRFLVLPKTGNALAVNIKSDTKELFVINAALKLPVLSDANALVILIFRFRLHIWFLRGLSSKIGLLLNLGIQSLEKVIYYASFIVIDVDENLKNAAINQIRRIQK